MDILRKITRTQIVVAGVVVLALVAGLVVWKLMDSSGKVGEGLTPKKVLTIASNRAVSACQALPETEVGKIYGELSRVSRVSEQYVDTSFTKEELKRAKKENIDARCLYTLEDDANSTVQLTVSQYVDETLATEEWRNSLDIGSGSVDQRINEYQKQLDVLKSEPVNPNPTLEELRQQSITQTQQLIDSMKKALPAAKRQGGENVSGLDNTILFNPARGTFAAVYKNSVVKLDYKFGGENLFDESRAIQPSEVGQVLGRIKQTYDVIFKNLKNDSLSQAPASTFRKKDVTKVGSTQILEPCEILDEALTKTIFGAPSNFVYVDRTSTIKDATYSGKDPNGNIVPASNDCTRYYDTLLPNADAGANFDSGFVTLEMAYAASPKDAKAFIDARTDGYKQEFISNLASDADTAQFLNSQPADKTRMGAQRVHFQKGNYAGYFSIVKSQEGKPGDLDTYVYSDKAIFEATLKKIIERLPKS